MSPVSRPALSLVIPCWNEGESLPYLLERFASALRRPDVELVLVDNGSTDKTAEILPGLMARYPFCRVVSLPVNRGYGGGILAGLKASEGRFLGWTHADLQTDPSDALRGLDLLETSRVPERTVAKGLRTRRPFLARAFTWGMAAYASARLRTRLWDINGQPVLFHRSLLDEWRGIVPEDFTLDLAALYEARRACWEVVRFPVAFAPRPHGRSTWDSGWKSKWRMAASVARACASLRKGGP